MNRHIRSVPTAYGDEDALDYDAKRFTTPHGILFNQLEMEQFRRVAQRLRPRSKVLDVGCGTGRFTKALLADGHEAYALDPSPSMLSEAMTNIAGHEGPRYVLAEGAVIPFPRDTFHFVCSVRVINQLSSLEYALAMIAEMIRVCQPGGTILLEFVNEWGVTRKGKCVQMSVNDINTLLHQYPSVKIGSTGGVLFFSQRVMNLFPAFLLGLFGKVDRLFASLFPKFCTRCYVALEKGPVV
jgi:ubiquinone/menaquinone biosynthesis C-methylase UbiE